MRRMRGVSGLGFCALLIGCLAGFAVWAAPVAEAHGGRFNGPGGRGLPPDTTAPAPPAPKRGPPPTTPPSGIPSTKGSLPDIYWGTWWALNRWAYLPERGEALRQRRAGAVTSGGPRDKPPPEELSRERRGLLARQHIKPFLLELMDVKKDKMDTVRAAAMIALAKIDCSDATLERLLDTAENSEATPLERESAALAVGLCRRSDPQTRADPISLDLARTRLLALIQSTETPIRARCFSAFALGLLADQPYGSPFSKEGRLVVKGLLKLLQARHTHPDLPIALLTALSLQPRVAIPTKLHEDLRHAVNGAKVYRRQWSPIERSHALSTLARLEGPGWFIAVNRALSDRRLPDPVQRAARIALGLKANRITGAQRVEAAKSLIRADRSAPGALSKGLGNIALARILRAELLDDSTVVLEETRVKRVLLEGAAKGSVPVRGFNTLALALSVRDVGSMRPEIIKFVAAAREVILNGFDRPRGDNDLRGAYIVGIGLLRMKEARDRLVAVLGERNAGPSLRARAAIALAQIGAADPPVLQALRDVAGRRATHGAAQRRGALAVAHHRRTGIRRPDSATARGEVPAPAGAGGRRPGPARRPEGAVRDHRGRTREEAQLRDAGAGRGHPRTARRSGGAAEPLPAHPGRELHRAERRAERGLHAPLEASVRLLIARFASLRDEAAPLH